MEITGIQVCLADETRLKAYVTVVLDDCFLIRDLKVIYDGSRLFVAMPARKKDDGTFKDILHPMNQETREMMEKKILGAYAAAIQGSRKKPPPQGDPCSKRAPGGYSSCGC